MYCPKAYVVCGWADRATAEMDRTGETCNILDAEAVKKQLMKINNKKIEN